MAINLLGLLKDQMTDGVLEKMAGLVGENKSATSSAMNAILPTILGSVLQQGSTDKGAGQLMDMLKSGNHDGGMLDNLGSVLGGGSASSGLMDAGKSILGGLMGSRQSGVMDLLGKVTGLSRGSNTGLMGMVAPMVMGMIGRHVKSKTLNAAGLGSFLGGQKSSIMNALPTGMDKALGFANTSSSGASKSTASTKTTTHTPEPESSGGGGWIKYLVMGAIALGLVGFLGNYFSGTGNVSEVGSDVVSTTTGAVKSGTDAVANAGTKAVDATGNAIKNAGDAASNAAGNMADKAGNVVAGAKEAVAGAGNAATTAASNTANAAGSFSLNAGGDLVDGSGKVISKAGEFTKSDDGYYVDKAGNKIGKWLAGAKDKVVDAANKAGGAVAGAATKSVDAVKSTFTKMFKKEAGAASSYGLSKIQFSKEDHKIVNFSKEEVEGLAAALKANPDAKIKVQVHTADGKNALANKTMASARANVVQNMLVALGVQKGQISSKGVTKDAAKAAANAVEILVD